MVISKLILGRLIRDPSGGYYVHSSRPQDDQVLEGPACDLRVSECDRSAHERDEEDPTVQPRCPNLAAAGESRQIAQNLALFIID